jgi:hypothetical protein
MHTQMLPHGSGTCHIDFSFVEEPSRAYVLEVFEGFLGDREELVELLLRIPGIVITSSRPS